LDNTAVLTIFPSEIDVQGVVENPYVSTSESDELDELNDTKV
jgi:hypothetical protein